MNEINIFGHKYPYENFHELNLDWIIQIVRSLETEIKNFINLNTIKYADPILWDITRQYEANTVVVDSETGDAYISTRPVPSGVALSRTEYWTQIYNYSNVVDTLRAQIAYNNGNNTTAIQPYNINDLVFVNGQLYKVISAMIAGDSFVVDSNVIKTTLNDVILLILSDILSLQNAIADEAVTRENIDNALNADVQHLRHYGIHANILLIGDSYLDINSTSWGDIVIEGLHKTLGTTAFKSAKGGAGFSAANDGKNFNDLVNDAYAAIAVPDDISLVVFGGGYNDHARGTLKADTIATLNNCKSKFPNANIIVFNINGGVQALEGRMYVDNIYNEACSLCKVAYSYVGNVLKVYPDCINTLDLTHPTEAGQKLLGGSILSYILGIPNTYNYSYVQATSALNVNMYLSITEKDTIVNVLPSNSIIDVTATANGQLDAVTMVGEFAFTVADRVNIFTGNNLVYTCADGGCVVSVNSGQYMPGIVRAVLTEGKIQLYILASEISGGYMQYSANDVIHIGALHFSNTIPTIMV